jgi:hypothetical protein
LHDRGRGREIQPTQANERRVWGAIVLRALLLATRGDQHQRVRTDQLRNADERRTRSGIGPMPVLDEHDERPTAGQGPNERLQCVEQGRLEMFAAEVPWKHVDIATRGQQVQKERQELLERCVDGTNSRGDVRARQRRPEVESRAQNLHEDAVGNGVAIRSTPREQGHARCGAQTLLELVE